MEWVAIVIIVIWCIYAEWRIKHYLEIIESLIVISQQQRKINQMISEREGL